jgi:hypothetical protein
MVRLGDPSNDGAADEQSLYIDLQMSYIFDT